MGDRKGSIREDDRYFRVDKDYLRHEAEDAWNTFFAPFMGVYRAARQAKRLD